MAVDQVVAWACAGEPATERALALRAALRQLGPSEIYAAAIDGSVEGVRPLHECGTEDLVCFQASRGAADVVPFLAGRRGQVVVVHDDAAGAEALRPLAGRTHRSFDVTEMPPAFDPARLSGVEPHGPTAHHLGTDVEGQLCVAVGPVAPEARTHLLVEAFHVLVTYIEPEVKLALLGPGTDTHYCRSVQLFVHELNLAGAWLTGPVGDAERVAYYRRADVFVALDGSTPPALEAMSWGLPVSALPDDDPRVLAEGLAVVLGDPARRAAMAEEGRRRARSAASDPAVAAFARLVSGQAS